MPSREQIEVKFGALERLDWVPTRMMTREEGELQFFSKNLVAWRRERASVGSLRTIELH